MEQDEPEILEIKKTLLQVIPEWKNVSQDDIILKRMAGITNKIYKASVKNSNLDPVIYRKFGDVTENIFLDRETQEHVYKEISDKKIGPRIYAYADGVRIEQFIQSNVMPANNMLKQQDCQKIAWVLSKFHQLKPSTNKVAYKSLFKKIFIEKAEILIEKCQSKLAKNIYHESQKQIVELLKKWVTKEQINDIEKMIEVLEAKELSFCHNDLLANNVLVEDKTNKFIFIDYEYSGYNYPIYDIANYLKEAQYDYEVQQTPYFKVIPLHPEIQNISEKLIEAYVIAKYSDQHNYSENLKKGLQGEAQIAEKQYLIKVLPIGKLLSDLMWGWWGIIVCKNPEINFDYLQFCKRRVIDYYKAKKLLMK